jgi:hypothetical protein
MAKTTRFKEKLINWQSMYDTLAPKLTDMPQFTADHSALGVVLAQGRDLEKRQDIALGELRDVNQLRKEMIAQGAELRDRLASGVQAVLGRKSEKLLEFGVKPRPRIVRRKRLTKAEKAARDAAAAPASMTQTAASAPITVAPSTHATPGTVPSAQPPAEQATKPSTP